MGRPSTNGTTVLQLTASPTHNDEVALSCTSMGGTELATLMLNATLGPAAVHRMVAQALGLHQQALQLVLPGGQILQYQSASESLFSLLGIQRQTLSGTQGCKHDARSRSPAVRRRLRKKMPLPI